MKGFLIAALLLPTAAAAQDWASKPNDELCISLAVQMISGQDSGKQALIDELTTRGEDCSPSDMYIKIAQARLEFIAARARDQAQPIAATQSDDDSFRRGVGRAAQAYLLLQQQRQAEINANRPITTTCRHNDMMGTTTCDTR